MARGDVGEDETGVGEARLGEDAEAEVAAGDGEFAAEDDIERG